jgi:5-methylcytosine-specific restriction endonuclease McrA
MSPTLARKCPACKVAWITRGPYCPRCAKAKDAASPSARGYGYRYQKLRALILERDGWRCHWCGGPATTVDHVQSLRRGGSHDEGNLVASCARCNSARGGRIR